MKFNTLEELSEWFNAHRHEPYSLVFELQRVHLMHNGDPVPVATVYDPRCALGVETAKLLEKLGIDLQGGDDEMS